MDKCIFCKSSVSMMKCVDDRKWSLSRFGLNAWYTVKRPCFISISFSYINKEKRAIESAAIESYVYIQCMFISLISVCPSQSDKAEATETIKKLRDAIEQYELIISSFQSTNDALNTKVKSYEVECMRYHEQ